MLSLLDEIEEKMDLLLRNIVFSTLPKLSSPLSKLVVIRKESCPYSRISSKLPLTVSS